ncbi:Imm51 family immunity protein [Paenibacillus sp.]|jgi:tetratricopeptide (TPR) repeat protein|uniref:Imm51 family immunity protein n=1 Tax=Paenibacillus sp. TaxID=58172 RepID=UPI00281B57D5|nr:Imm51 family immunity protein [Paenibacillus sp.]MDR0267711.1 immunity 51 family protein [Paenibacillus sp.]
MEKDLLEQLNLWHEEDEFEQIIGKIEEIPEQDRDYDLVSHLARALNNLERYDEALQQLFMIKTEGEHDPLWHFRVGYAYYYLTQYEDAVRAFKMAKKLDPEDEDTLMLLNWSRHEVGLITPLEESMIVQPNAMDSMKNETLANKLINFKERIKPFRFIEHDSGNVSLILNVGDYKDKVFQMRADEGFEGKGYDWGSLAMVFLEEKMPQLADTVHFDPEADMFCVYSDNREAVQSFAIGFKDACEDDAVIRDLFSRAELD